jgi:MFS family permease
MANQTLDIFIREALNRGETRPRISAALIAAGWTQKEVDNALDDYAETDIGLAVPKPRAYVSAREAFLYLVLFILLGVVAWNLGSLLFALIDTAIADELDNEYGYGLFYSPRDVQIRQAIAGLVVGGPLFTWLALHIRKQRRTNPAMQRSRVRKWLTYIALIIASCTLIGDAISLVYGFLAGELSTRLFLKLLVVAILAGGVFFYFIRDAEQGDSNDQATT